MNMEESNKKRDNLERAKTIMGKIDPALLSAALSEMMMEADNAEDADVAKVKEAIKGIYDSIPEGRDKESILSKAITELGSDIIAKEVKFIKENLASIDRETITEAAKDYVDFQNICAIHVGGCKLCINSAICVTPVGCKLCINSAVCVSPVGGCIQCINSAVCAFCISHAVCAVCINSAVCARCISHAVCARCVSFAVCAVCVSHEILQCNSIGIDIPDPWELVDPQIKQQLKEEIIQEVLQRPELSRAMKNMLKKIQDEK